MILCQFRDTVVASTGSSRNLRFRSNKSCLGLGETTLWCNSLSCAVNNLSILNETLDQPVALASANDSTSNASLAEVKVTFIADTAVIVYIWDGIVAVVAVDGVNADGSVGLEERTCGC